MSIIRQPEHTRNFTVLDNTHASDTRLTGMAFGILTYLLTKPAAWEPNTKELMKRFNCGRHRILDAMKVLEAAGYLVRHHTQDEKGRRIHSQTIHEVSLVVIPSKAVDSLTPLFDDPELSDWADERADFLDYKRSCRQQMKPKTTVQESNPGAMQAPKTRRKRPSLKGRTPENRTPATAKEQSPCHCSLP